ncbi:hypothetical protein NDU88_004012 [Pleurodeles waltl]|uniref:Uncharacterized protein n=1 Tax=Pleurodeles waltl TaxID=8319 RepID=A0AAV7NSK5_PLEWA|nr:hypothetical protein NDU88_004012 [Pleurodeles waltl]
MHRRLSRLVVAGLLHSQDQDMALQRTQEVGPFVLENGKVNMFPAFTVAVQANMASYMELYALLPDPAWAWLESHKSGAIDLQDNYPHAPNAGRDDVRGTSARKRKSQNLHLNKEIRKRGWLSGLLCP